MALMPNVMASAMFDACNEKMKLNRSGNYDNFATIKNQPVYNSNRRLVALVTELGWEIANPKVETEKAQKRHPYIYMVILEMSRSNCWEIMPG